MFKAATHHRVKTVKPHYLQVAILFITLFVLLKSTTGQTDTFSTFKPVEPLAAHKLFLTIESTGFLKNNEYFSRFAYGYTGIGIYFKPTLNYYFSNNLNLSAGIYMLKYAGLDHLTQAIPVFSIRYKPVKSLNIIIGNLYGTANHKLAEPLFRYDNFYQHHMEYGVQFLWNSTRVKSDLWLNWRNFIQLGDTTQEELTVGSSTIFTVLNKSSLKIEMPVQFLFNHKGGQLAPAPRPSIQTIFNGYAGVLFSYRLNKNWTIGLSQDVALYSGLSYNENQGINYLPFKNGWGLYTKATLQWKNFHLMTGFWQANSFIAPLGETQFQSVSEINPDVISKNRQMVTSKLWYTKTIVKGAAIEVRFENYYDTQNHSFDYSYGLWLKINSSFFITKTKSLP